MAFKTHRLDNFVGGWFVGAFDPSILHTSDVEVAVKTYKKGDYEASHHHKIATELTVVVSGSVKMNGNVYEAGVILEIPPGESTDFNAITDAMTVVVKYPGASNDKYLD